MEEQGENKEQANQQQGEVRQKENQPPPKTARRPNRRRRLIWLGLAIVGIAGTTALWLRTTTDSKYPHIKVDLGDGVTMESVDWLYGDHRKFVLLPYLPLKIKIAQILPRSAQNYIFRKGWVTNFSASNDPLWKAEMGPTAIGFILGYKLSDRFTKRYGPDYWNVGKAINAKISNYSFIVTSDDYRYGRRIKYYARALNDKFATPPGKYYNEINLGPFPEKYSKMNLTLLETSGSEVLTLQNWTLDNPNYKYDTSYPTPVLTQTQSGLTAHLLRAIGDVCAEPQFRTSGDGDPALTMFKDNGTLVRRADKGELGWTALQFELSENGKPSNEWQLHKASFSDKSGIVLSDRSSIIERNWFFISGNISAADCANVELEAMNSKTFKILKFQFKVFPEKATGPKAGFNKDYSIFTSYMYDQPMDSYLPAR